MTDNPEQPAAPGGGRAAAPPHHEVADDREHSLDPRSVTASRLAGLVWAAVLGLVGLIPALVVPFAAGFPALVWLMLFGSWLLFVTLLTVLVLVWPGVRYRHASYRVNDRGVQIRSGVLFRSVVSVPRSRVQHTDVSRGPIERNFGLATLIIHTAGTQHASVPLAGLSEKVADSIRDYLIDGGDDDAV